jgi:hypothetical protein
MALTALDPFADVQHCYYNAQMRLHFLTALGCLFWLLVLASGISEASTYGLYSIRDGLDAGVAALHVIPAIMITWTVTLSYFAAKKPLPARVIVASSIISAFGLLLCLGVLGRSV